MAGMQLLLQPLLLHAVWQLLVQTCAAIPLKRTMLDPCDEPKADPLIPTRLPVAPEVELRLVMEGLAVTVNEAVVFDPPTVTVTVAEPVATPAGTGTAMRVSLQFVGFAEIPLNVTVLVPCGEPKPVPEICTEVPTGPLFGFNGDVMLGRTVKFTLLLATPFAITTTGPVPAPTGTVVVIWPLLFGFQFPLATVATAPLKETAPGVEPKLLPEMTTCSTPSQFAPDEHAEGDKPLVVLIDGGAATVNVAGGLFVSLAPSTIT